MKRAIEWIHEMTHCPHGKNVVTRRFTVKDINAIQADALLYAATLVVPDGNPELAIQRILNVAKSLE